MIKKERKLPLKIRKLQALLRRLPNHHPKKPQIEEELAKRKAGFKGEQSIDYYLSFLPESTYYIFHDLRLPSGPHYFQLDTLILSPYFILILEVKNISGILYFDDQFNQFFRSINGNEETFRDPITQVLRQVKQLHDLLLEMKLANIPLESLVVFSNQSSNLKTLSPNPRRYRKAIHSADFPFKIEEFEEKYKKELLSLKDLRKLSNLLLKKHTPLSNNILEQYGIRKSEVLKGIHCPKCFALPMKRNFGTWTCSQCNSSTKAAHIDSFSDYSLLIKQTITNSEFREFAQLTSRSVSTKLLNSMNLKIEGSTKGRIYYLPIVEE